MSSVLQGKNVVLGITGSIACYKALDLTSKLAQLGAQVDVILTTDAAKFVTPLAFRSLSHRPVVTDMFDMQSELAVEHVALAKRADILAVAPTTAPHTGAAGSRAGRRRFDSHCLGYGSPAPIGPRNGRPHVGPPCHPAQYVPAKGTGRSRCRAGSKDASHQD